MLELDQNEKYRKGACGTVRTFGFLLLSLFSLYGGTTALLCKTKCPFFDHLLVGKRLFSIVDPCE